MEKIFDWFLPIKGTDGRVLRGVVQYETAPVVRIHLCDDDGKTVNLSACDNIVFTLERSDGTHFVQSICDELSVYDAGNGIIDLILCGEKTAVAGLCTAVLDLYSGGKHITCARLRYFVEPAIVVPEDEAAADSRFPILMELIETVESLDEDMRAAEAKRVMTNIRNGEAENSLVGCDGGADSENPSRSLGEGCISLGDGCVSGCMGYYIQAIDFKNKKIYLTDTKVSGLPTVGAGEITDLKVPYAYNVTAEPVKFSIINGSHYFLCGTIKAIENNVVTYNEDSLGFNGFVSDTAVDGHTFYVPTQPTVGVVSFVTNAASFGSGVINVGKCSFGAGRDLVLADSYCANFGRGNTTVYGAFAFGQYNDVLAQLAFGGGTNNSITGYLGFGFGQYLDIRKRGGTGFGRRLKVYGSDQFVRGVYNLPDGDERHDVLGNLAGSRGKYVDIVGNGSSDTDRSNAYTLDWNGNARYAGKVYAESKNGIGEGKELATKESVDTLETETNNNINKFTTEINNSIATLATKEQFVQMIGTFEPLSMGTAIEDDKHIMYNEVYNTLSYDILKDGDITYMHLEPSSEVISSSSKSLNINRYVNSNTSSLFSLIGINTVYLKLLFRTNWSEQDRKPKFSLYRIVKDDGTSNSSVTGTASENCVGNGEWETVVISASVPKGSIKCPQVSIQPGGNKNLSSATYSKGTYFDVAAWALFDNAELAESFDMKAAAAGLPGLDFGQRLDLKADKDLSNVDNDAFKAKAIEAGISGRGYKTIGTSAECDYVVTSNAVEIFQKAVDESEDGDTLVVLPGTYSGSGTLNIKKNVTFVGLGKPVISFPVYIDYDIAEYWEENRYYSYGVTYNATWKNCCFISSVKCHMASGIDDSGNFTLTSSKFNSDGCTFKGAVCDTVGVYTDCVFDECDGFCSTSYLYGAYIEFNKCKMLKSNIGISAACVFNYCEMEIDDENAFSVIMAAIKGGTIKYFGTKMFLISDGGASDVTFIGNVPFDAAFTTLTNCRRIAVEAV